MNQARWDIVLQVLEGPLAQHGSLVRRGPVVNVGADPGPGGLRLNDYRALEDRHAVLTAYDGGVVSITPTGTSQVRVAPHPNVDWAQVQPLRGPVTLNPGAGLHLGPVNRGVTLVFVESRPLDAWFADRAQSAEPGTAFELRANRHVPPWFIGGVLFVGVGTALAILMLTIRSKAPVPLGPMDEGLELYRLASTDLPVNPALRDDLDQAFDVFVQRESALVADNPALRTDRSLWDERLLDYVTRSTQQHARARRFWARLDAVVDDYAYVVTELRAAGLPEVFAAIPYQESGYRAEAQSVVCAKGFWQLMPEVAQREGVAVSGCTLSGRMEGWSPTQPAPVRGVLRNAAYVRDGQCIIPALRGCAVDERRDLAASTRGAIQTLKEAWEDPDFRASGAAVALTIASHNGGYDDARFGPDFAKRLNLRPAYLGWLEKRGLEADPGFIGAQIQCTTNGVGDADTCGSALAPETQHYVYPVLAQHFLAVCYYAMNYGDREAFRPWRDLLDGYCSKLPVPTSDESKKWM